MVLPRFEWRMLETYIAVLSLSRRFRPAKRPAAAIDAGRVLVYFLSTSKHPHAVPSSAPGALPADAIGPADGSSAARLRVRPRASRRAGPPGGVRVVRGAPGWT